MRAPPGWRRHLFILLSVPLTVGLTLAWRDGLLSLALARATLICGPTRAQEWALRECERRGAVAPLRQTLARHPEPFIRAQAARRLTRLKGEALEAIPELIAALDDPDWGVRFHAAHGLAATGAPASELRPPLQRLRSREERRRRDMSLSADARYQAGYVYGAACVALEGLGEPFCLAPAFPDEP